MSDHLDPKHLLAAGAAALVGAAAVNDIVFDDDASADEAVFDLDHFGDSGVADVGDMGDMGGSDDFGDSYSDYMTEQANVEATSEMMETMHETNMEVIDNMDGSDDYYYEDDPYDSW